MIIHTYYDYRPYIFRGYRIITNVLWSCTPYAIFNYKDELILTNCSSRYTRVQHSTPGYTRVHQGTSGYARVHQDTPGVVD